MSKPRPRLNQEFINKHLVCSKCKRPMEIDDKDTWNDVTTYWLVCPCNKEGTVINTNKNGHIVFPIEVSGEGHIIRTITKEEVMR